MQMLVFFFDLTAMLYYIFQWPIWDSAKAKFPFFSADLKTIEKADCSNFVLMLIFIILSKGMALAICFVTMSKATENINTIATDFSVDSGNLEAIAQLND